MSYYTNRHVKNGTKWNKDIIISEGLKIYQKYGKLSQKDFIKKCKENNLFCEYTLIGHFKNWKLFKKESGIKFIEKKYWTKEEIKNIFKKIYESNPNILRNEVYKEFKKYNITRKIIHNRFGPLDNLAKECNFKFKKDIKYKNPKLYEHEYIKNKLQEIENKEGYLAVSLIKEYTKNCEMCHKDKLLSKYGSWKNMCDKCEIKNFIYDRNVIKYKTKQKYNEALNLCRKKFKNKYYTKEDVNYLLKELNIDFYDLYYYYGRSIDYLIDLIGGFLKSKNKNGVMRIGRNETTILDFIEREKGIKLKRQYPVGLYSIDGYDEENNIAYEVDEIYHKRIKIKDFIREDNIKKRLKCKFIRLKESEYIDKIKQVMQHNLKNQCGETCST